MQSHAAGRAALLAAATLLLATSTVEAATPEPLSAAKLTEQRQLAQLRNLIPELDRLQRVLAESEPDNFVSDDYRLIRRPGYRVIFYFRRAPHETLAKYTNDPRFSADLANRFTQRELLAIAHPWEKRFKAHNILAGYVKNSITGEIAFELSNSEAEFEALAAREGWRIPEQFNLIFDSRADFGVPTVPRGPTGAKIERSGFATILDAPHAPYPDDPPPSENQPQGEDAWYARDLGISLEEAAKRRREQAALMPQIVTVTGTLRNREAGNFTSARMIHKPDWAYELYFKRDPEATLRKYTSNPRFIAKHARFTREELEALTKPWIERFTAHNITGGWGVDDTHGTVEIMMSVTEEEYREISAREGWGALPEPIKLSFAGSLTHPSVEDAARPFVRAFGQERRSTVIQLLAAGSGKIVLQDGCLRVGAGKDAPLAMFHRETGLGIDEQGYLALKNRQNGQPVGRIGEWFSWAGPNEVAKDEPALAELRTRCGPGPVLNVGNPESLAKFRARSHLIDSVAAERRISRERAWELLKRCWTRQEKQRPDRPPEENCVL